jgi:hypothetical protein
MELWLQNFLAKCNGAAGTIHLFEYGDYGWRLPSTSRRLFLWKIVLAAAVLKRSEVCAQPADTRIREIRKLSIPLIRQSRARKCIFHELPLLLTFFVAKSDAYVPYSVASTQVPSPLVLC